MRLTTVDLLKSMNGIVRQPVVRDASGIRRFYSIGIGAENYDLANPDCLFCCDHLVLRRPASGVHVLHGPAHSCRRAVGDGDEARSATYLRWYDDVEGLGRVQHQSQHGVDVVRPNLWLHDRIPMGSAAQVVFPIRAWITRACGLRCPSPSLLV